MSRDRQQPQPGAPRGAGPCREEALGRDIFVAMMGQHWHGMSLDHLAKTAIEAAAAFYQTWDRQHGERS